MDERHPRPERRPGLRHLDADDPAAEHEQPRRGRCFAVVASMFVHGRASASPGTGGIVAELPAATTTARRATSTSSADPHAPLAVEPRVAADELDVRAPRATAPSTSRPGRESTSSRRASTAATSSSPTVTPRHAARLGGQLDRPQQRLRGHAGVERALAADEPLLHDRDREPGLAEPPGHDLARRPGADHDHVELPLRHVSPPRRRPKRCRGERYLAPTRCARSSGPRRLHRAVEPGVAAGVAAARGLDEPRQEVIPAVRVLRPGLGRRQVAVLEAKARSVAVGLEDDLDRRLARARRRTSRRPASAPSPT